jgi:hypothetical protein
MTTDLVPIVEATRVELGVIRADRPAQLVQVATEAADALKGVIDAKQLYSTINGKRYVRVEGWTTLATMMGCLPREVSVTRTEEGTYTATVELVRMSDGAVLTRASAECGMDEGTWKARPDYARRSMAATRAVSKACRLAFSWVMVLAGYEVTPAEEIPQDEVQRGRSKAQAGAGAQGAPSAPPQPLTERPKQLTEEPAPWEPGEKIWPIGKQKGKKLKEFSSVDLVTLRDWIQKTGRYAEFADPVDEVLASRQGE